MDLYKYYTKEQYEEYGTILETAKEIDERLNRIIIDNIKNKKLVNAIKNNWKDRTYETYQYKGFWYYPPNDPEFIDD